MFPAGKVDTIRSLLKIIKTEMAAVYVEQFSK